MHRKKLILTGEHRYRSAHRPHLYRNIPGLEHVPGQKVVWMK